MVLKIWEAGSTEREALTLSQTLAAPRFILPAPQNNHPDRNILNISLEFSLRACFLTSLTCYISTLSCSSLN